MLGLPTNVIKHLRTEKIIESTKVGSAFIFDRKSVEEFQKGFNRDDYLSYLEFTAKIEPYVTFKDSGHYVSPVGIYVAGITLITGSDEIPDEYRVEVEEFGRTKYINKQSLDKTIKWMKKVGGIVDTPQPNVEYIFKKKEKKRPRKAWKSLKEAVHIKSRGRSPAPTTVDVTMVKLEEKAKKKQNSTRSYDYEPPSPHKSGWSPKKRFLQFKPGYFQR